MNALIEKVCKFCEKPFLAQLREHRRGGATFCSRTCSATHNNSVRPVIEYTCKGCKLPFTSKSKHAMYCSRTCSNLSTDKKSTKYRYHLNSNIKKIVGTDTCFSCGWDKTTCDVHHIVPRKKGGTDELHNLVVVCPNCHRLIDKNLLNILSIPTVSDRYRTMSSSGENSPELDALAGN